MNKIEKIWADLESTPSVYSTFLYKRYAAEILPDAFIALKIPEKLRCIAFKINALLPFDEGRWNRLKDIKVETLPIEGDNSKKFLLILLLNKQHKDIFSTLSEDLIFGVSEVTTEQALVERLLDRLAKWQSLFEKIGKQGLEYVQNFLLKNKDRLLSLVCPKLKSNDWKVPAHDRSSMGSYRKILTCAKKTGDKSTRRNGCNPVYSLYRHSMA
ncbi:PD-(D/E)XK motif protein [Haliscomenobacter hydrossis]|uniref:PD-(D/E)XK motif protein n=1 Tax=Haliscomenobacter hydrossis TaxID=2350 RepID=UPI00145FC423|nr:PD-(D/E)XK motif protein [Haliscomenobacter hydrossis]